MLKVGIIDSGINTSELEYNGYPPTGICISKDNAGNLIYSDEDLNDYLNHGTVCAKIIYSYLRDTELFIVKIFDKAPFADEEILTQAIKRCLDEKVDAINVSLGIQSEVISDELINACDMAYSMNIPIVAASHNDNKVSFPAYYPKVLGVGDWENSYANKLKYIKGSPIDFFINGEFDMGNMHFHGSSFACPKITGEVLNILHKNGKLSIEEIKKKLIKQAEKGSLSKLFIRKEYAYQTMSEFDKENLLWLDNKYFHKELKFKPISSLLVVPLYGRNFKFLEKVDLDYLNNTFSILQHEESFEQYHIPKCLSNKQEWQIFDTVAFGHINSKISLYNERDIIDEIKELVKSGKNFMVFDDTTFDVLSAIKKELAASIEIYYPEINRKTLNDFEKFKYLQSFKTPLISVVGVGIQEVVSVQCYIYKILKSAGYAVEYIAPVPEGELTGACFSYPLMHTNMVDLKSDQKVRFLKYLLKAIQAFKSPDIVITGSVTSVIPNTINSNGNWGELIDFLCGTQPDGLIVSVYATDTYEAIINNIKVIKCYTQAQVLCILFMERCDNISSEQMEALKEETGCLLFFDDPEIDLKIKEEVVEFFTTESNVLM